MTTVNRPDLVTSLRQALEACPEVDAAWEGGSAAFDTHDELSDIDVVAVVADNALDHVFANVEAALGALSPVALRVDMPPSPGWRQKFYRLRDASEFLVVDLVLLRRSDPLQFREVELHGNGRTWIDRRGLHGETHLDLPADAAAARARVPALRDNFAMFQHLATKERLRVQAVEALHFYQAFALRPLVEALRLLHCPQRRVFSVRYLARDLPPKVVERVTSLSFISDLDDLADKHDQVQTWFAQVMQSLEHDGPGGVPGPEGQTATQRPIPDGRNRQFLADRRCKRGSAVRQLSSNASARCQSVRSSWFTHFHRSPCGPDPDRYSSELASAAGNVDRLLDRATKL